MKLLAVAAIASLIAAPAFAQNSVTSWGSANYDVTGSTPGETPGCIMTSTFEIAGRSDVEFALLWDGEEAVFALTSVGWSAVKGEEYEGFVYYFPNSEDIYSGGKTYGYVYDYINKGFMSSFGPEFLDRLAADSRLVVAREKEGEEPTIVADFNLVGTSAAVAALRRCATFVNNREAARIRRESRNDYISKDPFAN